MKVAIVCGHFIPALGYLEVHLAKALALLGNSVHVITSDQIPGYVQGLVTAFGPPPEGVEVTRLKPRFSLGQIVVADGVESTLSAVQPDGVIVIGLGKRFPKPAFKTRFSIVTLLGDNAFSYQNQSVKAQLKNQILFRVFKRSTYIDAIKHSKALVGYTPESFDAAAQAVGGKWKPVLQGCDAFISLGFWPDEFYFSPEIRAQKRLELGFEAEDRVIITATRLVPEKSLHHIAAWIQTLPENVKWLMVGSSQTDYAHQFEKEWKEKLGDRVTFMAHTPRPMLNAFYNAADLAVYSVPAISVFEALGTGLPALLPNEPSLSHVGQKSKVGYFQLDSLADWDMDNLRNLMDVDRSQNATQNAENFDWINIARQLLGYF